MSKKRYICCGYKSKMHNYQPQKFIFSDRVVLGLIIFVSGGVINRYGAQGSKTCKIAKLQN